MFRAVLAVVLAMVCLPCLAQAPKKGRPQPAQSIQHGVGDRLTITAPIIVAADEIDSIELSKSFEAKDNEGVAEMLGNKKAIKLDAGFQLVVLEITTRERPRTDRSSVCRLIKDGKSVGKYAIHYTWFTTATMKMDQDN